MIFGEGPIIKNIAGDLNKLFLQGSRAGQPINVEGSAAANQGTAALMADRDPVIRDISTGLGFMIELPIDYIRVEYMESISGEQYINTGIVPAPGMGFLCRYFTKSSIGTSNFGCIFGARRTSGGDDFQLTTYQDAPTLLGTLRWGTNSRYNAGINVALINVSKLINNQYTAPNGVTVNIADPVSYTVQPIYLHALNENGKATQGGNGCRIYEFMTYNNSDITHNFIPCIRVSDTMPGYFDVIDKRFYYNSANPLFAGPRV